MPKTIVITGATRGLGLSLARKLGEADDTVHGVSLTQKAWKTALKDFPGAGKFILHQADLTDETAVKKLARSFSSPDRAPDILVNNAGYGGKLATITDLSLSEYEKLMASNLTSAFLMCKYFIPIFRKKVSGLIINVSSMAGQRAVPRLFGYSASKFGMRALTECVAKENADLPLFKCLCVSPGGMNTEMRAALFGKKDAERQQTTNFVARLICDVIEERIPLLSGSDIIIRHGKITGIQPPPAA